MTEKLKRYQISLDQECVDIVEFFEHKEMKPSGTVRLALKEFYTLYVHKSLNAGEQVIDENGKLSSLDALTAIPRQVDSREKMIHAPVGDESGASEDINIEDDPQ